MMGTNVRAVGPLPPPSPDGVAPRDRLSRHRERSLDPRFVRDPVRDASAERGRPSVDPVVCFEPQRILFVEGLRSERRLLRCSASSPTGSACAGTSATT